MYSFVGKVVIVTGAGRGIGKEIALSFAKAGAKVAIVDINLEAASETAQEIKDAGGEATPYKVDIGDYTQVRSMISDVVGKYGRIDILVNNAAVWNIKLFKDTEPKDWEREIRVNYIGTLNCIHSVLPYMIENKYGRIINIVSDAGRVGEPWIANYSGTKAGILGFSKALVKEVSRYKITVNCVSPGITKTPGAESFIQRYGEERLAKAYPLGRLGAPSDIANAVLFFAADESSYITGQIISVSGGYTTI